MAEMAELQSAAPKVNEGANLAVGDVVLMPLTIACA